MKNRPVLFIFTQENAQNSRMYQNQIRLATLNFAQESSGTIT
uniref:Uncharacterized protein n=1 Tax=Rhizophora mucronata TaxID=61149 RepID=A0A2P2Q0X1_RHIMU